MTAAKRFQITGVSMITGMERMEWKMNVHSCVAANSSIMYNWRCSAQVELYLVYLQACYPIAQAL